MNQQFMHQKWPIPYIGVAYTRGGNPPHPAQPQHTNHWPPRTRKRHQQEHRPQRPTESSAPTQHAKGRTGDCPGLRKETTTRRNVTQGVRGRNGCGQIGKPPLLPDISFKAKDAMCQNVCTGHGLQGERSACYMQCERAASR